MRVARALRVVIKLATLTEKRHFSNFSIVCPQLGTRKYKTFSVLLENFLELFAADGVQPQIVVRGEAEVFNGD